MENLSGKGHIDVFERSMKVWLDGLSDPLRHDLHPAYARAARDVLEHNKDHPQSHYFRGELARLGYEVS